MAQDRIQEIRNEIEAQLQHMGEPLFTSNISSTGERHLNACLHISPEDWDAYAEGFRLAGDNLVQYIDDNNRDQDFLGYPIVFLYRQYLELRLKELIKISSSLLGQDTNIPVTHNLASLWKKVRPNIEQVWPDSKTRGYSDILKERLEEFCIIDRTSEAFRYPRDTTGKPTLSGVREINLRHLHDVVQGISNFLDGVSFAMGEFIKRGIK